MSNTETLELPTAARIRTDLQIPSQRGRLSRELVARWVTEHPDESKRLARSLKLPAKSKTLSAPTQAKLVDLIAKPAAGRPKNPNKVEYVPSPVRAWALANGYEVKVGRGRLPLAVHEAYAAAHATPSE